MQMESIMDNKKFDDFVKNKQLNIIESIYNQVEKDIQKLDETAGAGFWGTPELANKYKQDTPGQHPDLDDKFRNLVKKKKNV
jgi:hypothetical protein